ncbi:putative inactive cadmium/zinc-transporting ATPase HMA3 [Telopea speciosissima]|uniref:putative inactive cadmium/zinc-transporting ATPase HMA3 n=1 Tax=Telopea speciosissima TaxID=54955 RepID=UPI001CC45B60|nr:putative inactive cadmium/zinc-transporting ATPase HMA3 [Telopea speciosissima]
MGSSSAARDVRKSYFDVLGLCCSSEVPLIEKILKQLDGIKEVSVIVPTRTVIVVHDNLLISQIQIVKALNQARLEANIRVYGEPTYRMKWPSPYTIGCGVLLIVSFFKSFYHPLQWVAVAAVIVGLAPIGLRSIAAIRNLTLDINILILIAVGGSIALGDYLEAGSIVFLFTIAEWLESKASHKATAAMTSLLNMAPQQAILADTGVIIDVKDVKVNTILAVKAGEVIPIDGIVVEGICEVDEKTLTGESCPVSKQKDNNVWAGTINLNGYITVKTTALAEDCVVAKMAMLVEEAQNNKSKTQRLVDDCTKYYTPVVVLVALSLAVIPAALKLHDLNRWFHLALVVLVSACPCALILSTPVATFCTLTKAAANGVLIKGGDYLEVLAQIKTMAFDKTGTITRGEFVVTDFQTISHDVSLNTLLYWVSSIESKSSHPMAAALVDYGRSNSIQPKPENVTEFENFPGEGIYGQIDGEIIFIGNKKIARRAGCETVPVEGRDTKGGATIGYIYLGGNLIGIFSLSDACRSGVVDAITELKKMSIKTVMLTGDSNAAAIHAQEQLGHAIEVVHAELLPEDKARIIKNLKEERPTAMIGDGINDAPALATADIGISMGISGSALATETGHVTLMSNDIRKIPQAIKLARKSRRKVIENVILSISTKVAVLALACSGHPLLWAAVLVDVGTCIVVILNSMLLLRGTSGKKSSPSASHVHKHKSEGGCGIHHKRSNCSHSAPLINEQCCSSHGVPHCESGTKSPSSSHAHKHKSEGGCGHLHKRSVQLKSSNCSHSAPTIHEQCCSHEVPHCENSASVVSCGSKTPHTCSESAHSNSITCQKSSNHNDAPESRFEVGEVENGRSGNSNCKGQCSDLSTLCHAEEEHQHVVAKRKGHCESIESHACMNLEKREIGGCCKRFMKECEGKHGCLGAKLGGLSEIIIAE